MKVFLSWSGSLSHKVACTFRDWLPSVLQYVAPYVSSEDIDKGARWSTDIAKELEESSFGILCITSENLLAPWLNFEAGALSKAIDKSRVSPFLLNVKRSDVHGPLLQFQSTVLESDDIYKLLLSINRSAGDVERLDENRLQKVFEVWWPQLEKELAALAASVPVPQPADPKPSGQVKQNAILEELLDLARTQQKLLRSPEELLPRQYLDHVLRRNAGDPAITSAELTDAFEFLRNSQVRLKDVVAAIAERNGGLTAEDRVELEEVNRRIADIVEFLGRSLGAKRYRRRLSME